MRPFHASALRVLFEFIFESAINHTINHGNNLLGVLGNMDVFLMFPRLQKSITTLSSPIPQPP